MTHCGCTTGSEENGWHEVRCAACIKVEMDEWARIMRIDPADLLTTEVPFGRTT